MKVISIRGKKLLDMFRKKFICRTQLSKKTLPLGYKNKINQTNIEKAAKLARLHDFVINELPENTIHQLVKEELDFQGSTSTYRNSKEHYIIILKF